MTGAAGCLVCMSRAVEEEEEEDEALLMAPLAANALTCAWLGAKAAAPFSWDVARATNRVARRRESVIFGYVFV